MQKKQALIQAAADLFADQGFDGTTTFQIAKAARVTEPLIYYHFEGKDELYTTILNTAFEEYFSRLLLLETETAKEFEKIENFIAVQLQVAEEMPKKLRLLMSGCPAKLKDLGKVCLENLEKLRSWQINYLTRCLEEGARKGEFRRIQVNETVQLLIALINGLIRQVEITSARLPEMKELAIDFCRRGLVRT